MDTNLAGWIKWALLRHAATYNLKRSNCLLFPSPLLSAGTRLAVSTARQWCSCFMEGGQESLIPKSPQC